MRLNISKNPNSIQIDTLVISVNNGTCVLYINPLNYLVATARLNLQFSLSRCATLTKVGDPAPLIRLCDLQSVLGTC